MTRSVRPASIQSAVSQMFKNVGGVENAAADMGIAQSTASYGTELNETRPGGLGVNYVDRLCRMDPNAALPVAQHFAQLAGGVFHPVDLGSVAGADIHAVTKEFSDVLAKHAEALSAASANPADYTIEEAQAQLCEVDELMASLLKFRAAMVAKAGRS